MFKTILVPTDGSPLSDEAAAAALDFAKTTGAKVISLSVAEHYPFPVLPEASAAIDFGQYETAVTDAARDSAGRVATAARLAGVPCESFAVQGFSAYEEIVAAAKKHGCDLIWMASHGRRGLDKLLLGSQAQKVLAYSPVPVLVYKVGDTAAAH